MTCPVNTYSADGTSCLVLPSGIKQYNLISEESKLAAIVVILFIMLMMLFSSLFIIRNNKNIDNQSLMNDKDDRQSHRIEND